MKKIEKKKKKKKEEIQEQKCKANGDIALLIGCK
jgi:hypothetical protein